MKIKYEFADGTVSEVEVSTDIGSVIVDSRKAEHAADERERYHREFSMDSAEYEGTDWAETVGPEDLLMEQASRRELQQMLRQLTPVQRRRLLCYADGMTYREIAKLEGTQIKAVQDSIALARKKLQKFFK